MTVLPFPEGAWPRELARALADVKARLGDSGIAQREPLFCDATELFRRQYSAASWLVDRLITRGGVATIGGEPKTAKTWLALEIALAVATGTPACGEFFAERGTAAYFFAEDLDRQVRNRLRALLARRELGAMPTRQLFVCPRGKFLDVTRDEDLAWIVASCRQLAQLDLLVLDPLRDLSSAAEDKSDEMGPVMRRLRLLGELLGCTILIVHHAAKATADTARRRGGQRLRGSGAIHGATDSGIYLGDPDGDGSKLFTSSVESEVKGARSAGHFALELRVDDDENGEAVRGHWTVRRDQPAPARSEDRLRDRVADVVRSRPAGFESKNEICTQVKGKKQRVLAAISAELEPGGLLEYRDGRIFAREVTR